jgi:hypothetical protein
MSREAELRKLLVLFSHFAYFMALKIIANLAKIGLKRLSGRTLGSREPFSSSRMLLPAMRMHRTITWTPMPA